MLTDDEITERLRRGYADATAHLRYSGPAPAPRNRSAVVLLPAAGLVGATAVGAVVLGQQQDAAGPRQAPVTTPSHRVVVSPTPSPTPGSATAVVHLRLAGFRFSYPRQDAGTPELARIVFDAAPVPADARSLPERDGAKAWVAAYPGTGRSGLWVQTPDKNGGRPVALIPNDWGVDRLAQLWSTGIKLPN